MWNWFRCSGLIRWLAGLLQPDYSQWRQWFVRNVDSQYPCQLVKQPRRPESVTSALFKPQIPFVKCKFWSFWSATVSGADYLVSNSCQCFTWPVCVSHGDSHIRLSCFLVFRFIHLGCNDRTAPAVHRNSAESPTVSHFHSGVLCVAFHGLSTAVSKCPRDGGLPSKCVCVFETKLKD